MTDTHTEQYIDKFGIVWTRLDADTVINQHGSLGGWFHGDGLTRLV